MFWNQGQYCDGVVYQSDSMGGCLCRSIFIRQAINPFHSAKVKFFQFLAMESV
jgi:hypothetical protein